MTTTSSETSESPIRVIIAEDNTLLREGLEALLNRNGFTTVAAVDSAESLIEESTRTEPELVVTDVRMPPTFGSEGLAAAVELREQRPGLPIVVLSQYVELSYLSELLDSAGGSAVGYLLKDRVSDVTDFAETLRRVHAGGTAVDPTVINQMFKRRRNPLEELTPREREVLSVMAEGHSNTAIAKRLFVSEAAVVKHVGNIMMKLDLPPNDDQNRRVAAVLAYLRDQQG
ncbi:response regulator transcription factor [Brevibacterium paucivorans]|uniref:DNA-binding response regulator n=1 Tax=Brevibacterium paucivorans TaxID=170994 RepID=A0A2N6VQ03_9MICO|nr:DNA-binding response regulator [Brevibacterium paucivorans]